MGRLKIFLSDNFPGLWKNKYYTKFTAPDGTHHTLRLTGNEKSSIIIAAEIYDMINGGKKQFMFCKPPQRIIDRLKSMGVL